MRYRLGDGVVPEGDPGTYDPVSGARIDAGTAGPEMPGASQSDVRTVDNAIFAAQREEGRAKGIGLIIGMFLLPLLFGRKKRA